MYKSPLIPAQKITRIALTDILKNYRGCVLRGEMGVGKSWIAYEMAQKYKKVLFVAQAGAIKDLQMKLEEFACASGGETCHITFRSYAKFQKMLGQEIKQFDLFVWDESHKLRNYSAEYTKRYVRIRAGKHLHMTGTPLIKSPKDNIYVLRKCGLFSSTKEFYELYFGAKKSFKGDFLELGPFQNPLCYQTNVDKVTVVLKHKDICKDQPSINFNIVQLPGDYTPPADITKETKTRVKAGMTKVKPAVKHMIKDSLSKKTGIAFVLCNFHDTAKAVAKELGVRPALTRPTLEKHLAKVKDYGGYLVTTLGLSCSSFDFNECDDVYMIESTYSYTLDQQSIHRCRRLGKVNDVNVTYYALEGEHSVAKSMSRQYLDESMKRSKLSPSQLSIYENCPGSYWLPSLRERPEYVQAAAEKGTANHLIVERFLSDPKEKVPKSVPKECRDIITYCRELIATCKSSGSEAFVSKISFHKDFVGTVDFWAYDGETLHVVDYKNGNAKVDVEDNIQLQAYTLMICETHLISPKKIIHVIYQKSKKKTCIYDKSVLKLWSNRVFNVIKKVVAAKDKPLEHLNKDHNCDFFCKAREYHIKLGGKMGNENEFAITGFLTYVQKKNSKAGNPMLNVGVSFKKLPEELKALGILDKKVKAAVGYSKEYDNYSLFGMGLLEKLEGEQNPAKGDNVTLTLSAKSSEGYEKATFFINKVVLIKKKEEKTADAAPETDPVSEEVPW